MHPLKGNVVSETPTTVTTAAGSIYSKNDLRRAKVPVTGLATSGPKWGQKGRVKSPLKETKRNYQPQEIEPPLKSDSEEETLQQLQEDQAEELFQNRDAKVTSKETTVGAGLNLATKRARPNHGEPASVGPKSQEEVAFKQKPKRQTAQEKRKLSCDSCNYNKPLQDD